MRIRSARLEVAMSEGLPWPQPRRSWEDCWNPPRPLGRGVEAEVPVEARVNGGPYPSLGLFAFK